MEFFNTHNISKDKQNKKKKIRIPKVPVVFLEDQEEEMDFEEEQMDFEEIEIEKDEIEKEMEREKVDLIDLYTFLFEAGIVFLSDKLTRERGKIILGLMTYLSSSHPIGDFHLFLSNCRSGCLETAITIHDAMQEMPRPGHTIAYGMTASVGSLILVSGHERIAELNARIVIQEPKWNSEIQKFRMKRKQRYLLPIKRKRTKRTKNPRIIIGDKSNDEKRKKRQNFRPYADVHEEKKRFDRLTENVHEIFVSKTGQSYETIQKDLKKKVLMSAEQAQDYGIIDRIVINFKKEMESVFDKTSLANLDENIAEKGNDTPDWSFFFK